MQSSTSGPICSCMSMISLARLDTHVGVTLALGMQRAAKSEATNWSDRHAHGAKTRTADWSAVLNDGANPRTIAS